MKELVVSKSNALIEASYKLTLQEQRFILACMSFINSKSASPETQKTWTLTATEFYSAFPEMGRDNAEREMKKAIDRLWDRSIIIKTDEEREEFRWVQHRAEYFKGEGKVKITFSDAIMPYLTLLKGQFTSVVVRNVSSFTSAYSIRIYEILMQKKDFKNRAIPLDELRIMLGLGDKYPTFKSLNQWVLKPSIDELNTKSDMRVTFDTVKQGRKIVALHFHFHLDQQIKMPLPN